eukprot:scaffold74073_cov36-Tisochrysis_lutea.AAC.2
MTRLRKGVAVGLVLVVDKGLAPCYDDEARCRPLALLDAGQTGAVYYHTSSPLPADGGVRPRNIRGGKK